MNNNAEICVKCGVKKNVGDSYCQICGTRTISTMTNCKKCGAKLMRALSSTQMKKKVVSKSKRTFGTILLIIGIILLFAAVANFTAGVTAKSSYYSTNSFLGAGRCVVFGSVFTGFGIRLRKK
jgi:uncharacterized membrane protein YvbJ